MIRPLRQRHRRSFLALGIVLPLAFTLGIAARWPAPKMSSLPAELVAAPQNLAALIWESADLFASQSIQVRLIREMTDAGRYAVNFSAPKDFIKPDLIVYWIAAKVSVTSELPVSAQLLGGFSSAPLYLPDNAATQPGVFILYSLADNEVVARSKPFEIVQATRK